MKHISIAVAAAAALATIGCGGGGVGDQPPTLGSFFIFDGSDSSLNRQVYFANMNGSGARRLTGGSNNFDPRLNHAGTRIAFATDRGSSWQIMTMNVDGSDVRAVTNGQGADDREPTWSIDDSQIFFVRSGQPGADIWRANADGTNIVQITNDAAFERHPVVSLDGARIFYSKSVSNGRQIFFTSLQNGGTVQVTNTPNDKRMVQFSPSTSLITWLEETSTGYAIMSLNGSGQVVMLYEAPFVYAFCWTPDGNNLLISAGSNREQIDIVSFTPGGNRPASVIVTRDGRDLSPSAGGGR
jgi:Tol biopolymer transport system component